MRWGKWIRVDVTPWQDDAIVTIKEMEEDDKSSKKMAQYKTKMTYGMINDPSRPLFEIWKREKLKKVI